MFLTFIPGSVQVLVIKLRLLVLELESMHLVNKVLLGLNSHLVVLDLVYTVQTFLELFVGDAQLPSVLHLL